MRLFALPFVALLAIVLFPAAPPAEAASSARFGLQDDAWITGGPGTLDERLTILKGLGVQIVRFNLRWDAVARQKPLQPRSHADPRYSWAETDWVLNALRAHGLTPLVTIVGTPSWANRGRASNWAPTSRWSMRNFAYAAGRRYPFVRLWTVWNEPNKSLFLRPTRASVYVRKLLNPAYSGLHAAVRRVKVAGGVTSPRGGRSTVGPVNWIRGMRSAGARLDAYAHHPYPLTPGETPFTGGCARCTTISMADLERLISEVRRAFGYKRIWLTEYGYQTRPPDRRSGVSYAKQSRFLGEAARRVVRAPRVDMLIHFLYQDERDVARWQSGLIRANRAVKPGRRAFALPLAQVARRGKTTTLWGQVRPRSGRQTYRIKVRRGGSWRFVGGTRVTNGLGSFTVRVRAARGTSVRIWSPRDRLESPPLQIR